MALLAAQFGNRSSKAKTLTGFGGGSVIEIIENFDIDTYRAVYTVRFQEAIYVLHVFQKKSQKGIQTSQNDLDLIRTRLKQAEAMHLDWLTTLKGKMNEL